MGFLDHDKPVADESLEGYLWRLASLHHYDSSRWFCDAVDIASRGRLTWKRDEVETIAALLDADAEDLVQRAHIVEGASVTFPGHAMAAVHVETSATKICPDCLAETERHSAVFNLAAIQVCTRHRKPLIHACGCGKPLRWGPREILQCTRCERPVHQETRPVLPPWEINGTIAIAKAAGFSATIEGAEPIASPEGLTHLGVSDLITLVAGLGTYASGSPGQREWQVALISNRSRAHQVIETGWQVVDQWPARFHAFLDLIIDEQQNMLGKTPVGMCETYGRLYRHIADRTGEPWQTVQKALNDHALDHALLMGRKSGRLESSRSTRAARFINEHDLARLPGIGRGRAHRILTLPTVDVRYAETHKRRVAFVDRFSVEALLEQEPVDLRDASKMLGLGEPTIRRLIQSGVIPALDGPHLHGHHRYLLARSSIKAFANALSANLPEDSGPSEEGDGLMRLSRLFKAQSANDLSLPDLMSTILSGQLRPVANARSKAAGDDYRVDGLLFRVTDIRTITNALTIKASPQPAIMRKEIMAALRVNKFTVAWLERHGLLKTLPAKGNFKPICRQSFDAFCGRWIKAGDLADQLETNRRLLIRGLTASRIPTTPLSDDPGIATFFDRSTLAKFSDSEILAMVNATAWHKGRTWMEYSNGLAERQAL